MLKTAVFCGFDFGYIFSLRELRAERHSRPLLHGHEVDADTKLFSDEQKVLAQVVDGSRLATAGIVVAVLPFGPFVFDRWLGKLEMAE